MNVVTEKVPALPDPVDATLRLPKRDLLRKDKEKERPTIARQSLKKQSSCCANVCSCFAAGGTAQHRSREGSEDVCFGAMPGSPLSEARGKRGPGL